VDPALLTPGTSAASSFRCAGRPPAGATVAPGVAPAGGAGGALAHTVTGSWCGVAGPSSAGAGAGAAGSATGGGDARGSVAEAVNAATAGNAGSLAIAHRVLPALALA
jgi:hypothetical protein